MLKGQGILKPLAVAILAVGMVAAALPAEARKSVVTTIAQIGQPLAEITAGKVDIVTLMGEGVDPHLYRLTRSDVAKINRADLILYNGLHLEAQMLGMLDRYARRKAVVAIADTLAAKNLLPGETEDPIVTIAKLVQPRYGAPFNSQVIIRLPDGLLELLAIGIGVPVT